MHPNVDAVVAAAHRAGLDIAIHSFPEGTRTAADAAQAVGCDVGQIVKSLVFLVDSTAVLAMVSGRNRLDETLLARATGAGSIRKATADEVRAETGFPIGGVPPLGHALAVFVDRDLLSYEEVWAAAGTPRDVFPVAPQDLIAATRATAVELAAF